MNSGPWNDQREYCCVVYVTINGSVWGIQTEPVVDRSRVLYTRRKGGKARESGKRSTGHRSRNYQNSTPSLDKELSNAQKTPVVKICVFPFCLLMYVLAAGCFIYMNVRPNHTDLIWRLYVGYHHARVPHLGNSTLNTGRSLVWSSYAKLG